VVFPDATLPEMRIIFFGTSSPYRAVRRCQSKKVMFVDAAAMVEAKLGHRQKHLRLPRKQHPQ
jgi:hypothetical protein